MILKVCSPVYGMLDWFILRFINESNIDHIIIRRPEVKMKNSKHVRSFVTNRVIEQMKMSEDNKVSDMLSAFTMRV
jgi:hypothetical protein